MNLRTPDFKNKKKEVDNTKTEKRFIFTNS